MIPYIPHTDADRRHMLEAIGLASMDDLFSDISQGGPLSRGPGIDPGLSERRSSNRLRSLAAMNRIGTCFLGMGCYDRIIPSTVKSLASLPSFVTAYTPYQPEISQGLLQAIFEFQSMVCSLTGMDVANASLYDGPTAAAEAAAMMLASKRKSTTVLVSETVHPFTIQVLQTWALSEPDSSSAIVPERTCLADVELIGFPCTARCRSGGSRSPNRYGYLEDYSGSSPSVCMRREA